MSRKLLVLLALFVIAAIVAYRASGWTFNWSLFLSSLSGMKAGWLGASVVLTLVTYWFRAIRWRILLAPLKAIGTVPLFWTQVVGFSAIYILGRAGELARPLWLTRREGVSLSGSLATMVVERILDVIMLITLLAVALALVQAPESSAERLRELKDKAWMVALLAAFAVAALFFFRKNASRIVQLIPIRRLSGWIDTFAQGLSFLQNGKTLGLVLAQSVFLWITIALQFWFLLLGMNFTLSAADAALVMVGAAFGSVAQVPGIGGGFQAGYILSMTTLLKVPMEKALATSLIATVMNFGPTVTVAGFYMLSKGISMRELKSAMRKTESETL